MKNKSAKRENVSVLERVKLEANFYLELRNLFKILCKLLFKNIHF